MKSALSLALALVAFVGLQDDESGYCGFRLLPEFEHGSFQTWSLVCDSGSEPLAAWQVELVVANGIAEVVGIQAGDDPAFPDPPTYGIHLDEGVLALAAFSLADELPTGRTRVATLHVYTDLPEGAVPRTLVDDAVACDREGRRIPVTFELVP